MQGDVGALPFEEGSFDYVLCMNGLHEEILNLLGIIIHYFIVPLQHGYGFTEFLHITSERGLRNGSLSVVGILHRGSVARIRTAEVLCQLSFA